MKNRLILIITILALTACTASTAFGEEFKTTIEAFEYGGYSVPAFDGDPSEEVNGNLPTFSAEELTETPAVHYGELDSLGRCTPAFGELNQSLMPTGERGSISSVKPSGWVQAKYDVVPAGWLYNRCHLIGWQLTGADLNTMSSAELSKNLITGTRFLNVGSGNTGMVGYENEVAAYLREDEGNFVSYRVTPVFFGDDLVASGVLMEGQSVASNDVEFCVFCYNVQPEIAINYATGESRLASALPDNKLISDCTVTIGDQAVYSGSELTIPIEIRDGDTLLEEGLDYRVVYTANILPGQATVQIAGIGSYKGLTTGHFVILPAKAGIAALTADLNKVRIEAAAQEGVSGYQYSWRVKGKKWKAASKRGTACMVKNLKAKTAYQFRVRAYTTIDGEKWFGKWSKVKSVRIR